MSLNPVRVWLANASTFSNCLAIPKSSKRRLPSRFTRTFEGLMSRWMTASACADCTASQSARKSRSFPSRLAAR